MKLINIKVIKRFYRKNIIPILIFFLFSNNLSANNVQINNLVTTCRNTTEHYMGVQFDISWDNSWRLSTAPNNWDASWVFVKYRKVGTTDWNHATLNYVDGTGTNDGHTVPANSSITSTDEYGVFIHANADMITGSVNYTGAQLRWNYGVDGIADTDSIEVSVFAVEMVYVPQASFYVGSGGSSMESYHFYKHPTETDPYEITSEALIRFGGSTDNLHAISTMYNFDIPTTYPKGYDAFYCMKYEISQAQYVAFLNTLTNSQSFNRFKASSHNGDDATQHQGISGSYASFSTSFPYVACGNLCWNDFTAYLDWAALRPMTDFEYEKTCRGPIYPVPNEYVWGNTDLNSNSYVITNSGEVNEGVSGYNLNKGNAKYKGPPAVRVGVFAADPGNSGRITSGATYYGVMEMAGNVWEYIINATEAGANEDFVNVNYTNANGNGAIDANGNSDMPYWQISTDEGIGQRGGSFINNYTYYLCVSNRRYATSSNHTSCSTRYGELGGRGVRSAQ